MPETPNPVVEPLQDSQRIDLLDLLRGSAVLGILIVNIQAMAMIGAAYNNPTAFGDFQGSNFLVWFVTYTLFDSKMMSIFSMLFGAGILVMSERAHQHSQNPFWIHTRRMFWLLIFGLLHAHLIWFGDILFAYAICGFMVFWVRHWSARYLIALGCGFVLVPVAIFLFSGFALSAMSHDQLDALRDSWQPNPEQVAAEVSAYQGSWIEQMPKRMTTALGMETFVFSILFFWRASGLMLIGMGLFKLGVLTNRCSTRCYVVLGTSCLLVGLIGVAVGVQRNLAEGFRMEYSFFFGILPNYVGSLFVAIGYVCAIALFGRCRCLNLFKYSLKSAGKMALTNYLLQSLIATTIFYGHGMGWFGLVSRTEQLAIVVGIWMVQLIGSPLWLHFFRFGPFEWLWRSLVYLKLQPLKRVEAASES